ncbi:GbsR/MarR family transcriptional regulator [Halpernia sp. GG3]
MLKTLEIDDQIFHKLVHFSSTHYHLTPLAAKIYAYLTFDFEMNGVTFEELVDDLKASKSSVSCSLDLLLKGNHIAVLNKIDERKRFFILNPDYVKIRFSKLIDRLEKEVDILEDLRIFKETKTHQCKNTSYITKLDIYIDLLKTAYRASRKH